MSILNFFRQICIESISVGRVAACFLVMTSLATLGQDASPPSPSPDLPPNPASGPITRGQRVFMCGHSYHAHVPPLLTEIAQSAGFKDHVLIGKFIIFGSTVNKVWSVPDDKNLAKQALLAGNVDVLTLTPIYLPDPGIERFAQLALQHNPDIRVTVQEFWMTYDRDPKAPKSTTPQPTASTPEAVDPAAVDATAINADTAAAKPVDPKAKSPTNHNAATIEMLRAIHQPYFDGMDQLVAGLNQKFGKQVLFVVPVGQAVIALREKIIAGEAPGLKTQSDLFTDSLGHPMVPLQVLVAYAHYAVIYRKSPIGLPVPQELLNAKLPGDVNALNLLLQQLAWDAVIHHPLSGVTGP